MEDFGDADPIVAAFVTDFLQYRLEENGYEWARPHPPPAEDVVDHPDEEQQEEDGRRVAEAAAAAPLRAREIHAKVGTALRSLTDEFSSQFKESFVVMCQRLDLSEVNIQQTMVGVANELFSEGIKWARIVAFFVFSSELALHCQDKNWPNVVNDIAVSLSMYITEKLVPWINDHGGWEGLVAFDEGLDPDHPTNGETRWPSVINMLCIGISALGALSIGAFLTKS